MPKRKGKAGQTAEAGRHDRSRFAASRAAPPRSPHGIQSRRPLKTDPPAFTPAQLQPAASPLSERVRRQNRPGAPPISPDAVVATIATTPPSRRPPPEEKPFDPLGIQVGAFNFRGALEYSRGYDNNVPRNSAPPRASSWYDLYAPELLINSNWSRHELTASLRGSYTAYDTNHPNDRPTVDAKVNGRIDVTSQTRIDLEGRYLLFTDNPGSPNIQADLVRLPIAMTYGTTAGVGQRFNRFDVTLKGTFDRTVYNDFELRRRADRKQRRPQLQPDRHPAAHQLRGDAGHQAVRRGRRRHPQIRPSGRRRRGEPLVGRPQREDRHHVRGHALAHRRAFGRISVARLPGPDARGHQRLQRRCRADLVLDALTTVKVTATTSVAELTTPGVSGNFTRDVTAQIDHAFRRWLIGTLKFSRGFDDYVGSEREDIRYVASSALAYYLTREIQLKGEYRQEWRYSNQPGNNYWAHVWLLGMRLQR